MGIIDNYFYFYENICLNFIQNYRVDALDS